MTRYRIDLNDGEGIYESAIGVMEESGQRFSVILDRESKKGSSEIFEGKVPSWLRLRGEMRRRGMQSILGEIMILESELLSDIIEKELFDGYNSGDKARVDICTKTLAGVISKARLGLGKLESDGKRYKMLKEMKEGKDKDRVLKRMSTEMLEKALKEIEDGD